MFDVAVTVLLPLSCNIENVDLISLSVYFLIDSSARHGKAIIRQKVLRGPITL